MAEHSHDLVVIGAGPGGYVAAIRAAQLGLNVACVEKESALGGTCLRVGCIPSKALLESSEIYAEAKSGFTRHGIGISGVTLDLGAMMKRKDVIVSGLTQGVAGLFKKNKVASYSGSARIAAPGKVVVEGGAEPLTLNAKHILIATGSVVSPLAGVELDGDRIGTSTEALKYPEVPGHLVVIGAGVIGLELGSVWQRLGAKVTVLEYLDRILPGMDSEIADMALKLFKRQGMKFELGTRVQKASIVEGQVVVSCDGKPDITCDRVLLAVGRKANTEGLGLEALGIQVDKRGCIPVDKHFGTTVPGIYAVGDVIAGPMLAHKASEEAVACVERIVTGYGHVDYASIPGIVYTHPEIATVGKSEDELKAEGRAYRKGTFPFMANGRAKALASTDGLVKILADAETDQVLGCAILGPRAGDLIAEVAIAIAFEATSEDVARACHAHPTLAEAVKEAALAVDGRVIHL